MSHSHWIDVANARTRFSRAQETCPHWDYENDGDSTAECCNELREAQLALRRAIRSARRENE